MWPTTCVVYKVAYYEYCTKCGLLRVAYKVAPTGKKIATGQLLDNHSDNLCHSEDNPAKLWGAQVEFLDPSTTIGPVTSRYRGLLSKHKFLFPTTKKGETSLSHSGWSCLVGGPVNGEAPMFNMWNWIQMMKYLKNHMNKKGETSLSHSGWSRPFGG